MKLNCKPGDLAVVVSTLGRADQARFLGMTVLVLKAGCPDALGARWLVEHREIYTAADACLRPIRDAGDDAVDESHAYLPPVPHKELA